jgi:hypothetical protein
MSTRAQRASRKSARHDGARAAPPPPPSVNSTEIVAPRGQSSRRVTPAAAPLRALPREAGAGRSPVWPRDLEDASAPLVADAGRATGAAAAAAGRAATAGGADKPGTACLATRTAGAAATPRKNCARLHVDKPTFILPFVDTALANRGLYRGAFKAPAAGGFGDPKAKREAASQFASAVVKRYNESHPTSATGDAYFLPRPDGRVGDEGTC